jgi:hypothetical protein
VVGMQGSINRMTDVFETFMRHCRHQLIFLHQTSK